MLENQFINADCLDIMREIPDKSIDLVLTDPPYGIGENNEKNLSRSNLSKCTTFNNYNWDSKKIGIEVLKEIKRVSLLVS